MTDRELLELAAKAADMWTDEHMPSEMWDPLTNDGDALRLAVKLGLSLESEASLEVGYCRFFGGEYEKGVEAWHVDINAKTTKAYEIYRDDPYAATRRAIVRAAADIGKAMK